MSRRRRMPLPTVIATLALVTSLGALAVACENEAIADPTPVRTFMITPAAGTPTPVASPPVTEGSPTPATSPTAATNGDSTTLEVAGISSVFDKEQLEAPAGRVVVVFDNRDAGIAHNIHFFRGENDEGESVGETELDVGPIEQRLEMDLTPGEYFYQCDSHPTTMTGTLTVQ